MSSDSSGPEVKHSTHRTLTLPEVQPAVFPRNFVVRAACELRYPTLVEFNRESLKDFRKAIRKTLPIYDVPQEVKVSLTGAGNESELVHQFATKRGDYRFTFKADALLLECRKYTSFEDFKQLLTEVLEHAIGAIDSDFFTRVGLRYINAIPMTNRDIRALEGWLNPVLVAALVEGAYGSPTHYFQEVRGAIRDGSFSFKHGLGKLEPSARTEYMLDFDFFTTTVDASDAVSRLESFHLESFRFFMWTIGPKAREYLGSPSRPVR
jgi:uncharacterized protein (TIGR04255 family)